MAEPLPVLIKLAENKVNAAERALAVTRAGLADLAAQVAALRAEVNRGGDVAAAGEDVGLYQQAGAFLRRARAQEQQLAGRRGALEQQQAAQQVALAAAYAECERYRTLWQHEQQRRLRKHANRQQAQLDDAASVADWRRREEE